MVSALSADPYFGSLWGLENVGQNMFVPGGGGYYPGGTADADMDVPEAWAKATGAGVTVGIVDTGLLATHPDLVNQVATNAGETGTDSLGRDKRSNGVDDDGNGYRDDWRGWDFVSGGSEGDSTAGPDNDPQDNHGHGTHVAGTIAAQRDNNEGISGVAPGAKIMSLRALGANGSGSSIGVAEAFDYAGKLGLRVVNASLGAPALDQTQLTAIQAHPNTLYVIAAGNSNVNNDVTPHGPCALPAANILCVGASDVNDRRAGFSNYGATSVDVFAPGTAILSTYTSPAYEYLQGTSMASPNVAGVAALVLSAGPAASALDVKSAIMASTEAKPDLAGKSVTGGRVNAEKAVAGAIGGAPVNVTPPVITGTPREGVALGASSGTWSPTGASYGYVWQRSFDGGSTWTPIVGANGVDVHPGRVGHRREAARHGHGHQPVRRRERDLGDGRPGRLGRPGQHRHSGHQRHAAPRPGALRRRERGTRPARPTRTSGSARPTAAPGRRSAPTPRPTRSRRRSGRRACASPSRRSTPSGRPR